MATSFRDRNPYLVGVVSILVLFAMVGGAFLVGLKGAFKKTYVVTAEFNDASGLKDGDDVKMAGIKIGRVEQIKADYAKGSVEVDLEINKGVDLSGHDSDAEVALETLLGTKFVRMSVDPGHQLQAPYLVDLPRESRRIPMVDEDGRKRTKTPFDIFDVAGTATRNINRTDTDKLNKLITELADVTQDKRQSITDLLNGIDKVSESLNSRDAQLRQLLDQVQLLTKTLADKDQALVSLIDSSQTILNTVNARRNDIHSLLVDNNALLTEVSRLIGTNRQDLQTVIDGLTPILDTVSAKQADIDRALTIVGPGAFGLALAPSHGPWQDIYIQALGPDLVVALSQLAGGTAP